MDGRGRLWAGMLGVIMVAACFIAGYLLLMPGKLPEQAAAPAVPGTTAGAPAAPADARHKYNLTIEANADWARVILTNGQFVTGDPDKGLNAVEMTSDGPQQVGRFSYGATELSVNQRQFATTRLIIKCVVETAEPTLQFRVAHGDNGSVKVSSPVDAFTNDRVTGDGQNFVEGGVRLE